MLWFFLSLDSGKRLIWMELIKYSKRFGKTIGNTWSTRTLEANSLGKQKKRKEETIFVQLWVFCLCSFLLIDQLKEKAVLIFFSLECRHAGWSRLASADATQVHTAASAYHLVLQSTLVYYFRPLRELRMSWPEIVQF